MCLARIRIPVVKDIALLQASHLSAAIMSSTSVSSGPSSPKPSEAVAPIMASPKAYPKAGPGKLEQVRIFEMTAHVFLLWRWLERSQLKR